MPSAKPWPSEIRLNPERNVLNVAFDSGERFDLRAEYLRVESPSAEVRNHGGPKNIVTGKEQVKIAGLEPVAGRKQLVTLFEAMGPADPRTLEARRKLSGLLFS